MTDDDGLVPGGHHRYAFSDLRDGCIANWTHAGIGKLEVARMAGISVRSYLTRFSSQFEAPGVQEMMQQVASRVLGTAASFKPDAHNLLGLGLQAR